MKIFFLGESLVRSRKPRLRLNVFKKAMLPILKKNGFKQIKSDFKDGCDQNIGYIFMFGRMRNGLFEYIYVEIPMKRTFIKWSLNVANVNEKMFGFNDPANNYCAWVDFPVSETCVPYFIMFRLAYKNGLIKQTRWNEKSLKLDSYWTVWGRKKSFAKLKKNMYESAMNIEYLFDLWYSIFTPCRVSKHGIPIVDANDIPKDEIIRLCSLNY